MDIYRCMGVYVSAIGHCMETWGVRQTLLSRLLLAIKGQSDPNPPCWTRSLLIASSAVGQFASSSLDPLWFDQPLLAMPLLDALALYISASPSPSSSTAGAAVKWICVAYLVQCFVNEIHQLENKKVASEESVEGAAEGGHLPDGWEVGPLFRVLYETVLLIREDHLSSQTLWRSPPVLSPPLMDNLFRRVLVKWIVFVRVAIRMTKRCDAALYSSLRWKDDAVSVESLDGPGSITNEMLLQTLHDFQLREIFSFSSSTPSPQQPSQSQSHHSIVTVATKWLHSLFEHGSLSSSSGAVPDCVKFNQWHYPVHTIPSFVELPNAYTKLHGQITSRCSFDYPAFCFVCGEIMDAGLCPSPSPCLLTPASTNSKAGKGNAPSTSRNAVGKWGSSFSSRSPSPSVLPFSHPPFPPFPQDCTFLLLFTQRGAYFTSPYVDSRGEKHRTFRGKPLFLDDNMSAPLSPSSLTLPSLKLVQRLQLSHGIPKEVTQKRSMSQRVIINNHY
jgi:hypothetical protein